MKYGFLIVLLAAAPAFADAGPEPGSREVLLENEKVQVVRLVYPVGSESGMHTHRYPNRVVYFVKGGKVELVPENPDEAATVAVVADGDTMFVPAVTHNVRNIGDTEIVIIETEIK